jgi:hypothetical protein
MRSGTGWGCGIVSSSVGGAITGFVAGAGLVGGGTAGIITMDVNFAGTGKAATVARSDHDHDAVYQKKYGKVATVAKTGLKLQRVKGIGFGNVDVKGALQAPRALHCTETCVGPAWCAVQYFHLLSVCSLHGGRIIKSLESCAGGNKGHDEDQQSATYVHYHLSPGIQGAKRGRIFEGATLLRSRDIGKHLSKQIFCGIKE